MILVDNRACSDPYLNIAVEDFLVRNTNHIPEDLLLLYINKPCIVLGKNQSIYKEINVDCLRNEDIKVCRRISGGGTVYHDYGNLNFSFISPFTEQKVNNYKWFNGPVVEALNKAGVPAVMDERNNILCHGKKISGNAQFTNRKKILSHGTLLFNADLQPIRKCLHENNWKVESKAVSSVKSPVTNICNITTRFADLDAFKEYIKSELNISDTFTFTDKDWKSIEDESNARFRKFEWIYGRSPKTMIYKPELTITVENGIITEITNTTVNVDESIIGIPYTRADVTKWCEVNNALGLLDTIF